LQVRLAGTDHFVARDEGLPQASSMALGMDRRGNVLCATNSGLAIRAGDHWRVIGQQQGLPQDPVYSFLQDREGSMWVGGGSGLARWMGYGQWEHWTQIQGLGNEAVWAVHRDAFGAVWVGTDRGLYRMIPGQAGWQVWTTRQNLAADKILALASGTDSALWAGSFPSGVSRVDARSGAVRRYGPESGLPRDPAIRLVSDRQGRLWVATFRGLFLGIKSSAGMRFAEQVPPHGDNTPYWRGLLEDRQGRIWVSAAQTLARWDNGQWTDFSGQEGLKSPCANKIAEGRDGSIWLGYCRPLGLTRLDFSTGRTKVDHFDRQNGLHSNRVTSLATDTRGWIWAGTANGFDVFDGARWRHLGEADGMLVGGVNEQAFFADPDGSVWMGTKGISHFQPGSDFWSQVPPRVTITSTTYSAANRSFDASFSALTFLNEKEVRFRYRLAGLETNWIETDQRQALYHGLEPGNYTFEVMARSAQGVWNPRPERVSFRAPPAWWQTRWFHALLAAGILLAIWVAMLLIHRWRVARVRAEFGRIMEERTRIARELHDTILQEVTGVSMLLGPFERQAADPELRQKLGFALSRLERTIVETRRAVWELRPSALERQRLSDALQEAGANLTAGSEIAFEFQLVGTPIACSPELEGELLRIGQETIQNAVKHSHASLIRMRLECARDVVQLFAEDDGIGFGDEAAGLDGWGLTGIRERVERLGGEMTICRAGVRGTRISVQVPTGTIGRHSAGLETGE
jgi:signal transduction histidine kinase